MSGADINSIARVKIITAFCYFIFYSIRRIIMYRKLACLVSFALMLSMVGSNVALGGKIWETRVSSGNDDAEQNASSGGMDLTSSDLEIFDDGFLQVIGLRFVDIPIPKGAIVDNAFIELTCDEPKSGTQPVSIIIEGELNPN